MKLKYEWKFQKFELYHALLHINQMMPLFSLICLSKNILYNIWYYKGRNENIDFSNSNTIHFMSISPKESYMFYMPLLFHHVYTVRNVWTSLAVSCLKILIWDYQHLAIMAHISFVLYTPPKHLVFVHEWNWNISESLNSVNSLTLYCIYIKWCLCFKLHK